MKISELAHLEMPKIYDVTALRSLRETLKNETKIKEGVIHTTPEVNQRYSPNFNDTPITVIAATLQKICVDQ